MGRNYRNHNKRRQYQQYKMRSKILTQQLKEGLITQEQFDREHEFLDEKFNYVR